MKIAPRALVVPKVNVLVTTKVTNAPNQLDQLWTMPLMGSSPVFRDETANSIQHFWLRLFGGRHGPPGGGKLRCADSGRVAGWILTRLGGFNLRLNFFRNHRRVAGGRVVQRHALYLGEINDCPQMKSDTIQLIFGQVERPEPHRQRELRPTRLLQFD